MVEEDKGSAQKGPIANIQVEWRTTHPYIHWLFVINNIVRIIIITILLITIITISELIKLSRISIKTTILGLNSCNRRAWLQCQTNGSRLLEPYLVGPVLKIVNTFVCKLKGPNSINQFHSRVNYIRSQRKKWKSFLEMRAA